MPVRISERSKGFLSSKLRSEFFNLSNELQTASFEKIENISNKIDRIKKRANEWGFKEISQEFELWS